MGGSAARKYLADLNHPDEAVRHRATLALGDARRHRDWAEDLVGGVTEGDPRVRFWAAMSLARADPDPALAVPALIAMLSDPDGQANRQVAARALATIGRPGAGEAVPALARVLETECSRAVRESAIRALRTLAVWNPAAISALVGALDDPDETVRTLAVDELASLGERAGEAVPALRRLAAEAQEEASVRAGADDAVERILSGEPALRVDEPYRSLDDALSRGRCSQDVADEARIRLEHDDYDGAFALLATADADQDDMFWLAMFGAAETLGRPDARLYFERYEEASGLAGFRRELSAAIRSDCTVSDGMRHVISQCAKADPGLPWERFSELAFDEDLVRLRAWLEAVLASDPPPADISGLWFGLVDLDLGDDGTLDMYVSGERHSGDPADRVIGGTWEPRSEHAYAESSVLDEIHRIASSEDDGSLEEGEYFLGLAYGALAVRWLGTTIEADLLLGAADARVLHVGFDEGDWFPVGTLTRDGVVFTET